MVKFIIFELICLMVSFAAITSAFEIGIKYGGMTKTRWACVFTGCVCGILALPLILLVILLICTVDLISGTFINKK